MWSSQRYDTLAYSEPKVHPDHHVEVARALYSVPGDLVGKRVTARLGARTVQLSYKGELIKVHARKGPGGRSTDASDLPAERSAYAMRNVAGLVKMAQGHGPVIGAYVAALLDSPLPWTKMRQAYRLLGLVKKWGAERVASACARALEAEAVDVNLIARMLERAKENEQVPGNMGEVPKNVVAGRFSRQPGEFCAQGAR